MKKNKTIEIPTIKTIEKRFDEEFVCYIDHEFVISNNKPIEAGIEQIKSFYRQQIEEILKYLEMEELKEGKHDGHRNDDRCWCYECQETGKEKEFTNNHRYNQAIKELNAKIKKVRGKK